MEGRWMCPRRRGGVRSLSTTGAADNFNANGVSSGTLGPYDRQSCVVLNIMFVDCRKAGGECKQLY
jgi:hypothetical protein